MNFKNNHRFKVHDNNYHYPHWYQNRNKVLNEKNTSAFQFSLVHKTLLLVKKTEFTDYNENVSDIVVTVNGRSENNNVDHDESKEQILFHNDTACPLRICETWLPLRSSEIYLYIGTLLSSIFHDLYYSYISYIATLGTEVLILLQHGIYIHLASDAMSSDGRNLRYHNESKWKDKRN